MKLMELMPDPMDALDSLDQEDDGDHKGIDKASPKDPWTRRLTADGENKKKADKIANLAKMKAKSTDVPNDETTHTSFLGGHFTSFLDRGGHG